MAEQHDDGLIREINEELRQEQLATLWKRYRRYIIGAAVAIVAVVAGYKGWQAYDRSARLSDGAQFAAAAQAMSNGNLEQAETAFARLAEDGTAGYALLARFRSAALLVEKGDRAAAAEAYRDIAASGSVDTSYREAATILAALNALETEAPQAIIDRLEPLRGDDSAWRHSARELTALAARRMGDEQRAIDLYRQLTDDAATPRGVRARAQEMLAVLGAS